VKVALVPAVTVLGLLFIGLSVHVSRTVIRMTWLIVEPATERYQ